MATTPGSSLSTDGAFAVDQSAGYPFVGPDLVVMVGPFAAVAAAAEASLALPPGPVSMWPTVASVVLLAAVAGAFLLPWSRLPAWTTVLVPLTYLGAVLALILAAGPTSGVGIVILIPLVWTALFHRPWESACVVVAAVAVEVIISMQPVLVPEAVLARRVLLWAALGTLISVATHGLRDRIRRSEQEAARLQGQLSEVAVMKDRDRIAADLRDKVIQRIFAAGLTLQGAVALASEPEVRRRVETAIDELDQAIQITRDTIFSIERQEPARSLRAEIIDLCGELSLTVEITFSGPVDGALHPSLRAKLLDLFREALTVIAGHATPARIGLIADQDSYLAVIEAHPAKALPTVPTEVLDRAAASLRDAAAQAGMRFDIDLGPDVSRFAWRVPLSIR